MGLQIWLPLNGSFENKGLTNANLTTSGSWSTISKIGTKSFTSGTITMDAATTGSIYNNDEMTFAFWFYANAADGTSTGNCIIGNSGMSGTNNRKFAIFNYSTVNDLHWSWQVDGIEGGTNGAVAVGGTLNDIFPSYQWTHVCITYKNPTAKIYINGVQKATSTGDISSGGFNYSTPILNLNASQCVNDLRIYDHALSVKEVKQLAQGLIAHYPLNNNGCGAPNLITTMSAGGQATLIDPYTLDINYGNNKDSYFYFNVSPALELNKTYTISFDVENFPKGGSWSWYLFKQGTSAYLYYIKGNGHYKWTFSTNASTLPEGYNLSQFIVDDGGRSNPANIVRFSNFKIEEGSEDSNWCPHTSNENYLCHSFAGTTVYDCSGYENNATTYETVSYSGDSIRHDCSTVFSGAQAICCKRGPMVTDAITVNLWGYMDDWTKFSDMRIMSCTEGGGWNFENVGHFICYANGTYQRASGNFESSTAGWHMITGTWDGYQAKVYLDGVLKASSTALTTKYPIIYNTANGIFIGAEAAGTTTTPGTPYFTGKISDVKIFATALSADDIKELYQVSISIDEDGQIYGSEFREV